MFKKFLPHIIVSLFLAGFVAYAWTEPAGAPPNGNVPAPINVGTTLQYKSGTLGIGGVLRAYSDAIFDGNVCIGGACKSAWPVGESVMYLRATKDYMGAPDPALCPGGWTQADYQQEVNGNFRNAVRACYRCN